MPKVTKSAYTVELTKDEWELVYAYYMDHNHHPNFNVEGRMSKLVGAVEDGIAGKA